MMIRRQQGFVSLVSVALISVVVSIITISLVGLMTNEVRQSNDAADRVQAQYAAESGAQDALAYIKAHANQDPSSYLTGTNGAQYCSNPDQVKSLKAGSGIDPAITCREIVANGTASGTLQKNQSVQLDLSDTTKLDNGSLEIDWDVNRASAGSGARTFSSPIFSNPGTWQTPLNGHLVPPAIELTVASNSPSNAPAGSTQTQSIYLLPKCVSFTGSFTDGACNQTNFSSVPSPPSVQFGSAYTKNQTAANCSAPNTCAPTAVNCFAISGKSDYDCKAYVPGWQLTKSTLNLPEVTGATQYILRLTALYAGGDYQIILRNCSDPSNSIVGCNPIPLALSNAQIDVTAQVGGAYQRVTDEAPVRTNPLQSDSFALLGEDNLCKTFDLFNEGAGGYVPQGQGNCSLDDPITTPF